MPLNHNAPSRIREFRHLFAGSRRIVATVRIDLAHVRARPGAMRCFRCQWEGSKVRQPSAELYPEYKAWMDLVFSDVTSKTGSNLLYVFELPGPAKRVEAWLYESNCAPRMLQSWANPFNRPLSEVLAGMPQENWENEPC